jgi:endoglucanase
MWNRLLLFLLISTSLHADWAEYKHRFIQKDGRVIDKSNQHITHSEAIGYTLYFAYIYHDDETFERVYTWYKTHLPKNTNGLISWKWGKDKSGNWRILDKNNASDGDLWIAYDLLLMAERKHDLSLQKEARLLIEAIKSHLVIEYQNRLFLLPAKDGYLKQKHITVNLSYYIFTIFEKFKKIDPEGPWDVLLKDGKWLLDQSRFSVLQLPADWINIDENLTITPSKNKSFGYDAIRIPLNIMYSSLENKSKLMQPYIRYVDMMTAGESILGTVALETGDIHLYDFCFGHLAIYNMISKNKIFTQKLEQLIQSERENYYAYALYLFSIIEQ